MRTPDPTLAAIAARFDGVEVRKVRGGDTLVEPGSGDAVARLKSIADSHRFELFYRSTVHDRWRSFGDFGRLKLTLERAHEISTAETVFRLPRRR